MCFHSNPFSLLLYCNFVQMFALSNLHILKNPSKQKQKPLQLHLYLVIFMTILLLYWGSYRPWKSQNQEKAKDNQKPEFSKMKKHAKTIENTGGSPVFSEKNRLFFQYFFAFWKFRFLITFLHVLDLGIFVACRAPLFS